MTIDSALRSLRGRLTPERRSRLRRLLNTRFRGPQHVAFRLLFGSNLDLLAWANATDKNTTHRYTQHYARHLAPFRKRRVKVLEIGIGGYDEARGYDDPNLGGGSLRMWRTYFPRGRVYGIDIHDKRPHDERRIKTFRGSQADTEFLGKVVDEVGSLNVVIDDGSHRCDHVITSFEFLFPRMSARGVYAVEDVQTSYWESFGGDDRDPDRPDTIAGYFKGLIHGLNYEERPSRTGEPTFFEKNIVGISFYHNLIVIEKGPNTEGGAPWLRKAEQGAGAS
jgi:demethylmacrocin O-methyltransferase